MVSLTVGFSAEGFSDTFWSAAFDFEPAQPIGNYI